MKKTCSICGKKERVILFKNGYICAACIHSIRCLQGGKGMEPMSAVQLSLDGVAYARGTGTRSGAGL